LRVVRIFVFWTLLIWSSRDPQSVILLVIVRSQAHITTENCAQLDYYAASSCNLLPTFWDSLSVINCHYSLRNNPEERSSHLLRGWSPKSLTYYYCCRDLLFFSELITYYIFLNLSVVCNLRSSPVEIFCSSWLTYIIP
jgi:hypothetical protein